MKKDRHPNPTSMADQLRKGWSALPDVLNTLGYEKLRPGQQPVICNILAGKDTLCVLPTGAGKTACFVLPTLCLNWKTVVFSPLVALMRDQVQSLQRQRIPAMAISGMQTDAENNHAAQQWAEGNLSFLYVAPERLHNARFKDIMAQVPPDMVVLDEAHTLSQWSDNFRSSYCKVGEFIHDKQPGVVAAFTATCPLEVENDIRRVLGIAGAEKLVYYPRRTNLNLRSRPLTSESDIAGELQSISNIRNASSGPAIIYCSTISRVERTAAYLGQCLGEEVVIFHGDLTDSEKRSNMDLFMSDRVRVVCATNAFGMGVDKSNIRRVIHRDIPGSVEALAQEIGRAGRDGKPSECITFVSEDSIRTQRFFIECGYPAESEIRAVYDVLKNAANRQGVVELTLNEISNNTNIYVRKISPIMEILKSNGVIERTDRKERIFKIRAKSPPPRDERFERWWEIIETIGIRKSGSDFYEVDAGSFVDATGLTEATVRNWFKRWANDNWIRYIPPFAGSPTVITGDASDIDFRRLEEKGAAAFDKLNAVIDYTNTENSKKHEFLEKYFEINK